jgi:hypothetical protein
MAITDKTKIPQRFFFKFNIKARYFPSLRLIVTLPGLFDIHINMLKAAATIYSNGFTKETIISITATATSETGTISETETYWLIPDGLSFPR